MPPEVTVCGDKAALTAARDKARSDYLAAEAKITAEVQD